MDSMGSVPPLTTVAGSPVWTESSTWSVSSTPLARANHEKMVEVTSNIKQSAARTYPEHQSTGVCHRTMLSHYPKYTLQ